MAGIIIFNKEQVVFSGLLKSVSGEVLMSKDYMDTPYGLFMPQSSLSFSLLRFLKNYSPASAESLGYKPAHGRYVTGILLSNTGCLEEVIFSSKEVEDYSFLDVLPINEGCPVKNELSSWRVITSDAERGIPLSEMAASKTKLEDIIKFIDEFAGERFVNQIVIDRAVWLQERKEQGLTAVLASNYFTDK